MSHYSKDILPLPHQAPLHLQVPVQPVLQRQIILLAIIVMNVAHIVAAQKHILVVQPKLVVKLQKNAQV